jgi:hypothetical protein
LSNNAIRAGGASLTSAATAQRRNACNGAARSRIGRSVGMRLDIRGTRMTLHSAHFDNKAICRRGNILDEDETINILADIIVASHGTRAERVLADRIKECEEKGDEAGLRVWQKVAAKISGSTKK